MWPDLCRPLIPQWWDNAKAFGEVAGSLGIEFPKRDILEKNLNGFFSVVRDDLLLRDLAESVQRAVEAGKA